MLRGWVVVLVVAAGVAGGACAGEPSLRFEDSAGRVCERRCADPDCYEDYAVCGEPPTLPPGTCGAYPSWVVLPWAGYTPELLCAGCGDPPSNPPLVTTMESCTPIVCEVARDCPYGGSRCVEGVCWHEIILDDDDGIVGEDRPYQWGFAFRDELGRSCWRNSPVVGGPSILTSPFVVCDAIAAPVAGCGDALGAWTVLHAEDDAVFDPGIVVLCAGCGPALYTEEPDVYGTSLANDCTRVVCEVPTDCPWSLDVQCVDGICMYFPAR